MAPVALGSIRPVLGADQDFPSWLAGLKQDALGAGIGQATLDAAFAGVAPLPHVLELDQRQPETTITFDTYITRVVSDARIQAGRQHLADDSQLLTEIGAKYGVQPRFIVALWAIETDFGRVQGDYPIVASLATLAYDGRRGAFFRKELIAALKILDQGRIQPQELRGSWAGAMGQTQFMPSTFLAYAVDYAGTGKQDIWHDKRDALASIANYLSNLGWSPDYTWGRPVKLPPGFDPALLGGQILKSVDQWRALGVKRTDGGALPQATIDAGLVQPGGPDGPTLMVYGNYRAIMKWNRSLYFATAVSYLADRIES
ncbi:MAG: lytic murein transglycosylase [Rhodospirillales bacterium]|nr:lytic murein transglycosylase [Rhodospirillales bacterium]